MRIILTIPLWLPLFIVSTLCAYVSMYSARLAKAILGKGPARERS